jgi:hypothetical protein
VTIPNPEHFLLQAEKLIEMPVSGRPRQVDIRRAISNSYYALFHAVATEAADDVVGFGNRLSGRYALVYRSINHGTLRQLCEEIQKPVLSVRYKRFEPPGGFAAGIKQFAADVVGLQRRRHSADYDPLVRFRRTEAQLAISGARAALAAFIGTEQEQRQIFIALLLFPIRSTLHHE